MNMEPSLHVCGITHCTWRTFDTKDAGKPWVGFRPSKEVKWRIGFAIHFANWSSTA